MTGPPPSRHVVTTRCTTCTDTVGWSPSTMSAAPTLGGIAPTPVAEGGQVVIRQLLKLTLSCDHRVVDGAVGARFLQTLKAFLENPVTMLA